VSIDRQTCILFARNDLQQLLDPFAPLRSHNAELRHMRPQSIDQLGPLPHQKVAPLLAHHDISLRCGIWPLSGQYRTLASRTL
jgi:hypothetical protein